MKKLLGVLYAMVIFAMYGCTGEKNKTAFTAQLSVDESKTKKIFLAPTTSVTANVISYFSDDNRTSLFLLNTLTNSLEAYNWETGRLIKKIKLEKEGPNGVGTATAFYIQSLDSIYILSGNQFKVTHIDSTGNVKNKYSLFKNKTQKEEKLGEGIVIYGDEANNITLLNNHLYSCASPFDDPAIERYYSKGHYGLDLNIKDGSVNTLMPAPSNWKDKFNNGFRLTNQQNFYGQDYNAKKGTCIVSFMTENVLYEVNLITKSVIAHQAKSNQIEEVNWMRRSSDMLDPGKELDFFVKNHFYPSVYYDKYRDIYLRFAAHPNKNKKERTDDHPLVIFSIILLDSNFNKIGEELLDENYPSNALLITKESIYIKKKASKENEITLVPLKYSNKN